MLQHRIADDAAVFSRGAAQRSVNLSRQLSQRAADGGMDDAKKRLQALPPDDPVKLRPDVEETNKP